MNPQNPTDTEIAYFGIGPLADGDLVGAIMGRKVIGRKARLGGHGTLLMGVADIPVGPRAILRKKWGPGFEAYGMIPCMFTHVEGMIWDLTAAEYEMIKLWQFVPDWLQTSRDDVHLPIGEYVTCSFETVQRGQLGELLLHDNTLDFRVDKAAMIAHATFLRTNGRAVRLRSLS